MKHRALGGLAAAILAGMWSAGAYAQSETKTLGIGPGDPDPRARDSAIKAALEGIDLLELDNAVKTFIQRLKHPWPEDLSL